MIAMFPHTSFLAILKWKLGECSALSTARNVHGRLVVLFEMPAAGDFDHELQRPLTPTEHIRFFGRRLNKHWGQQPAFIDAKCIDDDLHKEGLTRHPLTELLEKARLARALAVPATSRHHSDSYQSAVRRFIQTSAALPICIRVASRDLDDSGFASDLISLLHALNCEPTKTLLVLDFKGLAPRRERN